MYLAIAALLAFGAWTGAVWNYASKESIASYQQKQAAAQDKIDAQAKEIVAQAQAEITNTQAAFEAGQAKGKVVYLNNVAKGQSYVASTPVFSNPVCVVPDDGMLQLNGARSGVYAATAPGVSPPPVPGAGTDPGRKVVQPVPPTLAGQRPLAAVHPKPVPLGRANPLP